MEFDVKYEPKIKGLVFTEDTGDVEPGLKQDVEQLNTLCMELIGITAPVPPNPTPETFNKDMSKMIKKLYEGGVQSFKQEKFVESAKQFTIAIEIINRRNKFESFQGTLQELSLLLMSRADAYLKCTEYLKAFNDADMLIGMMMCTPDNFLRRGVANYFLGNYEDARADYQRGLAFDENNQRLVTELNICLDKILDENGDYL
ncbi:putative translocation protein [Clavispora lusitaniae]|uniref:Sec63 complex subunit n=2 Tax=Clavispora lusitaniae TaxID=36911 RepID=A0AA91Q0K5_CLALS|nr:Tetratricopeptide repeat family protein [Clavispora lusitaniae]OVF08368.1 putative Sec63 complex subunit [Clavispora lusitaniae]QFZ25181.1 putative translocation protein [Clavispora lusitaniae]QFZ31516.1 putative translocation protein [Clavispora lusitaniae]QFZ37184.1 putative translocation protein [Clavispora lusitaniae]